MRTILFFIAISSTTLFASITEVSIRVGDQYPLKFNDEVFISASRRGIVDVFSLSSTQFKIIALKPGFVSLLISKKDGESRVLVTVEKEIQKKTNIPRSNKFKVETIVEVFNQSSLSSIGRRQLLRLNYKDLKAGNYEKSRVGRFNSQVIVQEKKEASIALTLDSQQRNDESVLTKTRLHQGFKSFVQIDKTSRSNYFLCQIRLKESEKGGSDISDTQKNLFQTTVALKTNKFYRVGQVDLDSFDQSKMQSNWLVKFPIIGPLFKLSEESKHQTLTLYFIKISRLKD